MKLEPVYNENIIVIVIFHKVCSWYVTDKDLWFMDYNKLHRAYNRNGLDFEEISDERLGIEILDNDTAKEFLLRIAEYQISNKELNKMLESKAKSKEEFDDLLDYCPNIYVDFDNKKFYSMFPEPASFEDYIPEGWTGEYRDFTELVPDKDKFWINDGNENIFLQYGN